MKRVAMDLVQVLQDRAGKKVDKELYEVICGLPLAIRLVRQDIERSSDSSCCADKTRLVLKTYFYEQLGIDVLAVPFQPKVPNAADC